MIVIEQIVIYQTQNGETAIDVKLENETVWLTQAQMVILFERDQLVISRHISSVFKENELDKESNIQNMHIANSDEKHPTITRLPMPNSPKPIITACRTHPAPVAK